MLATQWFEPTKRVIAITIGANANTIGMAIGSFFPTIFIRDSTTKEEVVRDRVFLSLVIQAGITGALMLMTLFSFQDTPPTPPSPNAVVKRKEYLFASIMKLLKDLEYNKLSFSFGVFYANIIVLFEVIQEVLLPFGFTEDDAAMLSIINVISGILGAF